MVLQCKIVQRNSAGTVATILVANTILYILVNLPKWYIHIFFMKVVVGVPITLTQKINDCRQLVVAYDEDTGDQNGKPFTLFFPLSSAYYHYYHYFHSLLTVPTNAPLQNTISAGARTRIKAVLYDSLIVTLLI